MSKKNLTNPLKKKPEETNSEFLVMDESDLSQAKRTGINYKD